MRSRPRAPGPDALLDQGARALGLCLTREQIDRFRTYREELLRWAARMNLTALRSPEAIVRHGFLDALACAPLIGPQARRVLDLGSGAGFPGIPLAQVRSEVAFTLIDASRKKVTFLRHIVRTLELTNVTVLLGRAEALDESASLVGMFDLALARAVAPPIEQARLVRPYLVSTGAFLLQAGEQPLPREVHDAIAAAGFLLEREFLVPATPEIVARRLLVWRRNAEEAAGCFT
jgi:16S rRNA (guanine527-N7)-methyltransferase